jgi:Acetyltransferases
MPESIVIREIYTSEIDGCAEILRRSFADVAAQFALTAENCPTNPAFITSERLKSDKIGGARMYALISGGEKAGFMAIKDIGGGIFSLEKLAVLPQFRHRGYGTALIDSCKSTAAKTGGTAVTIGIIEENAVLRNWYEKHGFIHKGTAKFPHLPFTVGFMELPLA